MPLLSPGIVSPAVARLTASPALASALGHNASALWTTKVWADFARYQPAPPWLVVYEVDGGTEFESFDQQGNPHYYFDGTLSVDVYATSADQARLLSRLLMDSLDDAPLSSDRWRVLEIRHASESFDSLVDSGLWVPATFSRSVVFRYKLVSYP